VKDRGEGMPKTRDPNDRQSSKGKWKDSIHCGRRVLHKTYAKAQELGLDIFNKNDLFGQSG